MLSKEQRRGGGVGGGGVVVKKEENYELWTAELCNGVGHVYGLLFVQSQETMALLSEGCLSTNQGGKKGDSSSP